LDLPAQAIAARSLIAATRCCRASSHTRSPSSQEQELERSRSPDLAERSGKHLLSDRRSCSNSWCDSSVKRRSLQGHPQGEPVAVASPVSRCYRAAAWANPDTLVGGAAACGRPDRPGPHPQLEDAMTDLLVAPETIGGAATTHDSLSTQPQAARAIAAMIRRFRAEDWREWHLQQKACCWPWTAWLAGNLPCPAHPHPASWDQLCYCCHRELAASRTSAPARLRSPVQVLPHSDPSPPPGRAWPMWNMPAIRCGERTASTSAAGSAGRKTRCTSKPCQRGNPWLSTASGSGPCNGSPRNFLCRCPGTLHTAAQWIRDKLNA